MDRLLTLEGRTAIANEIETLTTAMLGTPRNYTQARGDKVQRYSLALAHERTYPGATEACRDPQLANQRVDPQGLKRAAEQRPAYKGYRWAFLSREQPDDTVQDIGETVTAPTAQHGLVAMINLSQDRIVDVFPDMTAAAQNRGFKGCSPISNAIRKGAPSGGHFFRMWSDCSTELQATFRERLPSLRKRKGAQGILRINPITAEECLFSSKADAIRGTRMSRKTLENAIAHGSIVNGYRWRVAGDTDCD